MKLERAVDDGYGIGLKLTDHTHVQRMIVLRQNYLQRFFSNYKCICHGRLHDWTKEQRVFFIDIKCWIHDIATRQCIFDSCFMLIVVIEHTHVGERLAFKAKTLVLDRQNTITVIADI